MPPKREAVRVKVIAAKPAILAQLMSLTGVIKARFQNDLSFRVSGKIVERPTRDVIPIAAEEQLIVELYSK